MNARNYGLPQSRPRLYWIGIAKECLAAAGMDNIRFPAQMEKEYLSDWLDPCSTMPDFTERTEKQQANILHYEKKLHKDSNKVCARTAKGPNAKCWARIPTCAVGDHSRDKDAVFKEFYHVEDFQ